MITGIKQRWNQFWSDFGHTVRRKLYRVFHLQLILTADPSSRIERLNEALEGKDVDDLYRIQSYEISVEPDRMSAAVVASSLFDKVKLDTLNTLAEAEIVIVKTEASEYTTDITVSLGGLFGELVLACYFLSWLTIFSLALIIGAELRLDVVVFLLTDISSPLLIVRWVTMLLLGAAPTLLFVKMISLRRVRKECMPAQNWLLAYCYGLFADED